MDDVVNNTGSDFPEDGLLGFLTLTINSGAGETVDLDSEEVVIRKFLQPLKEAILKEQLEESYAFSADVPTDLLKALCQFIWDPDIIYANKGYLRRLYNELDYNFQMTPQQSDLDDFLDYKPTELMAYKASQVFICLVLPDLALFKEEMENFKMLIEDNRIARDGRAECAYLFLYNVFNSVYEVLADQMPLSKCGVKKGTDLNHPLFPRPGEKILKKYPKFDELMLPSKCVIHSMSVTFIKMFRVKIVERTMRMEQVLRDDNSCVEWCINLAETLRLRRRESHRRWASPQEMALLEQSLAIAPENPFVRLALLDTIIGSVRDSSGRFFCGDIQLENMEDSMRYLHDNCLKLVEDFPNNVKITSIISDYFARYFPHQYFDVDLSLKLLESAYRLNPSNPKTAHRFGILYRMSFGNINKSLEWLTKAVELDPTYFKATYEYFKTLFSKPQQYDVPVLMQEVLDSYVSAGWSEYEKSDFMFYLGLAHFAISYCKLHVKCPISVKREHAARALEIWQKCVEVSEEQFNLVEMHDSSEYFQWDRKLDIDAVRLFIQEEKMSLSHAMQNEKPYDKDRKAFVDSAFNVILSCKAPFKSKSPSFFSTIFPSRFRRLLL